MIIICLLVAFVLLSLLLFFVNFEKNETPPTPREKFAPRDGITLYDNHISPCARRVRMALILKKLPFKKIEVNILEAEQKTKEFLAINPNGKVPALRIQNVKGIPDCCLFEANVITEFIDLAFPQNVTLYPSDPWQRAQVKIWQEWELTLWEDFYPLVVNNMMGIFLRLEHGTAENYERTFPREISSAKRTELLRAIEAEPSHDAMLEYGIECYRNLLILEAGLADKSFLVGNSLTMADLSVYPRASMFPLIGLPIEQTSFPNITRYFRQLSRMSVFPQSDGSRVLTFISKLFCKFPGPVVALSNWRSGKQVHRFDGSRALERVLGEEYYVSQRSGLWPDVTCSSDDPIVCDYITSAESLQVKILLNEMGVEYTIKEENFMEIIRRPQGSGGYLRYQHGSHLLVGARATMEYLDSVFGNSRFLPREAMLRAECLCWQAWEQTFYSIDLQPIFEREWVSQMLHKRYPENKIKELLDLRFHPHYFSRFTYIMKLYLHWVTPGSPLWGRLAEDFEHLAESHEVYLKEKQNAFESIHKRLSYLEESLQRRKFLVGSTLTIADICVFARVLLLPFAGVKISTSKFPATCEWIKMMRARRCVKSVVEKYESAMYEYQI